MLSIYSHSPTLSRSNRPQIDGLYDCGNVGRTPVGAEVERAPYPGGWRKSLSKKHSSKNISFLP